MTGSDAMTMLGLVGMGVGLILITALIARWKRRRWWLWAIITLVLMKVFPLGALLLPVVLLFTGKANDGSETSAAAKAFGQGAAYAYVGGGTGIAIDTAKRAVRLKSGKHVKEYPFTDVRKWRSNLVTGGEVVGNLGAGAFGGIAAAGQNVRVARENRKMSGFFVSVADIDQPEWRIDMPSEADQSRWMEILQQTINENRG